MLLFSWLRVKDKRGKGGSQGLKPRKKHPAQNLITVNFDFFASVIAPSFAVKLGDFVSFGSTSFAAPFNENFDIDGCVFFVLPNHIVFLVTGIRYARKERRSREKFVVEIRACTASLSRGTPTEDARSVRSKRV